MRPGAGQFHDSPLDSASKLTKDLRKLTVSLLLRRPRLPLAASSRLQTSRQCSPTSAGYFLQTKELKYMTSSCDH